MSYHKVRDHEGLVKDTNSGAILLNNHVKAREYLMKKQSFEKERQMASEINTIKEKLADIDQVKTEISEIKSLLLQLANNGSK